MNPQITREISVIYCGETTKIRLPVTATVLDLKQILAPRLGFTADRQVVFSGILPPFILENHQVLGNIVHTTPVDTVLLRVKIHVSVWILGTDIRYNVIAHRDDNWLMLKARLGHLMVMAPEAGNMKVGLVDPFTYEVVLIGEETYFYTVVTPVPIRDGTEFVLRV